MRCRGLDALQRNGDKLVGQRLRKLVGARWVDAACAGYAHIWSTHVVVSALLVWPPFRGVCRQIHHIYLTLDRPLVDISRRFKVAG